MKEENMHFGEYVRKKRQKAQLTLSDIAEHLGVGRSYLCDIENGRKKPLDGEKMELFAEITNLTEEETALLYDLASRENRYVPHDIEDVLMYEEVGNLARTALRLSKNCSFPEAEWKQLIRKLEANQARGGASSPEVDNNQ